MRSKFITDPQDAPDGFLNTAWDQLYTNFFPFQPFQPSDLGKNPPDNPPTSVEILGTPALTSEAVESSGAQSGPTTPLVLTTGGITINLLFDAAAMAAPASFRAGIQQAASILTAAISDKITVNIKIDYSGTGGGAAAGPDGGLYESYSSVRADLITGATPGDTTFNALPSGSSIQGQSNVAVWNAQLKLWGLLGASDTTTDDGSATFATDINSVLLVGVALHELTHAMGRVPYGPRPDIFDLFRFTSAGTRLFSGSATAPEAYFSVDGGNTKLADYGRTSDSADFLNSGVPGSADPFNEFYGGGTLQSLTAADKAQLDALGFHTMVAQNGFVVAATTSRAIQGGPAVTLLSGPPTITDPASTTLSSATIKIANASGSAVTGDALLINGQQSGTVDGGLVAVNWNNTTKTLSLSGTASIAAYQTLLSQITYQDAGTDPSTGSHPLRTTTWTINDGTSSISNTTQIGIERAPVVTAANVALNSALVTVPASSLFTASDPDGDAITTYAFKDTGSGHFVLNGVVQANNQEINVTAAQLAQLTYQNAVGTDVLQIRVNDGTQWGAWQSFAVTGPVVTSIEAFGSTSLTLVGNTFYLYNGGAGPSLKYAGATVVAGQFGAFVPIGAEQTASGYDVVWKTPGVDQYTAWNTDSNGNYISNIIGVVSGTSSALESLETTFHQDLNGDGVIGLPTTVIEAFGSTSLTGVGNNFYLYNGGTGPSLKYAGATVVVGQFGAFVPIGAEQIASGYVVAWKIPGVDQYTAWSTDSSGNRIANIIDVVPGTSTALESLETTFHQDLNGDGTIGVPTTVIEAFGSTSLTGVGNNFYLYNGGTGPSLKYAGATVVVEQFGAFVPIGAEQTASGYVVAWKIPSADQYTAWSTDSSGNRIANIIDVVPGTSTALESLETTFHQDLNGDGTIGVPTTVIEAFGSTSLTGVGNNFYLYNGGTGPSLKYAGATVVVGQFGAFLPIGAEQTASGYVVAWKIPGADQYTAWSTDSSGNRIANIIDVVPGTSTALESLETTFHQDLNGDGTIGVSLSPTRPAIELAGVSSASVTFTGSPSLLMLDTPSKFSGQIIGLAGDGILAGSDQIDLRGMNYSTIHASYDRSTGVLDVSDGTSTADLKFIGTYSQANFKFADDGSGGTIVYDAPTSSQQNSLGGTVHDSLVAGVSPSNLSVKAGQDSFIFAPNFGQVTLANFNPTIDTIQISHSVFANITMLLAATHDDPHGNVVITDAAHDSITIQHFTTAQLLAHQGDFHFV
jgi:Tryptophan-rich Synechocystis species C-terminal domain